MLNKFNSKNVTGYRFTQVKILCLNPEGQVLTSCRKKNKLKEDMLSLKNVLSDKKKINEKPLKEGSV